MEQPTAGLGLVVLVALFTARDCPKHMIRAAIAELPANGEIPTDPAEIIDTIDTAIAHASSRMLGVDPWE